MKIEEPCNINAPSGATPMTIADAVIRECSDMDFLKDVMFYLKCWLSRTYPETIDELYIKIYANAEPQDKAEKMYQICDEDELKEVVELLKKWEEFNDENSD